MSEIALAVVNLAALAACISLLRRAPCWMASMTMALLVATSAILTVGYCARAFEAWWGWYLTRIGYVGEHVAVLLTLFRLCWQREEAKWRKSLASYLD